MDDLRRRVLEGEVDVPAVGEVSRRLPPRIPPYVVTINGEEIAPIVDYLTSLTLSDMSPLTVRSYAHDLLRWWRILAVVNVDWDRATTSDVELLVGWLRITPNPQRRRSDQSAPQPGTVNLRTGKPLLARGYAPSTINHALTVVSGFYEFHLLYGRGPLLNPVPASAARRRMTRHHSPLEPDAPQRRGPLRQRCPRRVPRSIPDGLWDELFTTMSHDRDRALLAFYVSSGARASELLGVTGADVDWANKKLWVVSKGSRELAAVPGSPEAFTYLARYLRQCGTPGPAEPVWRTLRGDPRPLTYWAMRRIMQRANAVLGTNWTLHDLRHTAATRMVNDPSLTLPEVQTILRHRHLSATEQYLQPRIEELHDKLQEHFTRSHPEPTYSPGYDADDIATVFGE
ncbi:MULTISPECIES: tyrosine-type recombinase/integrase [unclassified Gordonia (in: high G+C Gram-positive bacteria)]|uniref:tyrosine-type recombinase/integrase n=1 Tax=unclassified Gordonia (in: high G+C Gram-positive bacteria) TaxID=2657482 RepID=UPI001DE2661D|nr:MULTISPECIES: tyrosine-type recombinase/integrase [unclassified Gordonia (in: high G+C Gram-positive bacteria)]MBN0975389.1 tyrosine-type recombinase/integrase [Gordonia sp. BP-119]MBN0985554.1 tyrosine-type recombinase/integrase [Gordonia sp. BP-94]